MRSPTYLNPKSEAGPTPSRQEDDAPAKKGAKRAKGGKKKRGQLRRASGNMYIHICIYIKMYVYSVCIKMNVYRA